ncbi:MAG: hypothetical protein JWP35_1252 [Caulobacter sp.]|nr:hypothetical protein [Caulobacter sp.]
MQVRTHLHARMAGSLALILMAGVSQAALAAEADNAAAGQTTIEEVVVTARRREENLQNVPVAVTAVSATELQTKSIRDVESVARDTPSLNIQSRAGDQNTKTFSMRGQVQTDTLMTLDPSVGVYLNDVYMARSAGANLDLFDVTRVEILAGPQGTLYGRNTTGGAVKVVTEPATVSGVHGYVSGQVGNFNMRRLEGALNLPLGDKVAVRVAGLNNQRDGYSTVRFGSHTNPLDGSTPFNTVRTIKADDVDTQAVRLTVLAMPTDQWTLTLVADWSKSDTNGTIGYDRGGDLLSAGIFLPFKPFGNYTKCSTDFYTACLDQAPHSALEASGIALTSDYDLGFGSLKLIYGHRRVASDYGADIDGSSIPLSTAELHVRESQDSLELQFNGKGFGDQFNYTLGAFVFREKGEDTSVSGGLGTGFQPRFLGAFVENKSKSVYGQGTYNLTSDVHLTVGARYTQDDKAISSSAFFQQAGGACLYTGVTVPAPTRSNCTFVGSNTFDHVSWTAGLDWQASESVMFYAKSSNGYRAGGQNLRGFTPVTQLPFNPEEVTDVELGVKSELFDRRFRFNADYYHSFYKDVQTSQLISTPVGLTTAIVNQGKADIDGIEAQGRLIVTPHFRIDALGSWTDVKYANSLFIAQYVPKYKFGISGTFDVPATYGTWSFHAGYSYQDQYTGHQFKVVVDNIPAATVNARGLVDARIGLHLDAWDLDVAAFGTNLTDEEYYETPLIQAGVNSQSNPTTLVSDTFNRTQVGQPRMFGLQVSKRF